MDIQKKRDFLTNVAYWALIGLAAYLCFAYIVPISVPFILGILVGSLVVWISRKLRCNHKIFRIGLSVLIYGFVAASVTLLGAEVIAVIVKWVPEMYELKLLPLVSQAYEWCMETIHMLNPSVISALEMVLESVFASLRNVISELSRVTVGVVSSVATGVPSLILSMLAMIFSTVFLVSDYEGITSFAAEYTPPGVRRVLRRVKEYLTGTLLVVIRSYAMIMMLTFTELSILFSVFGIEKAVLKAALIAMLDILPILGTGGILIPWAVISFVLGYTGLGIKLLVIYAIVTVIRNYVEPKIVGTQLGLHPIISLVSMFLGLRLFGFWGMFGLPVGISFLWKEKKERDRAAQVQDT